MTTTFRFDAFAAGPYVVNRHHFKGDDELPRPSCYIGRGTPLGNPFTLEEHGESALPKYKTWLFAQIQKGDPWVLNFLRAITDEHHLVCSCAPKPCHGDVVAAAWRWLRTQPDSRPYYTVYFDMETGGVEPSHPNIELSAIAVDDRRGVEVDRFDAKIVFDVEKADPVALRINHYDPEVWGREARPEADVVKDFGAFLASYKCHPTVGKKGSPFLVARLAGHNAQTFDQPRAQAMFERHKTFFAADMRVRDTAQLAAWWFDTMGLPIPGLKLGQLLRYFRITHGELHGALADCRGSFALRQRLRIMEPPSAAPTEQPSEAIPGE